MVEWTYKPVVETVIALFKLRRWRVNVDGAHHVPLTGPAVLASNHIGYLDFMFVGRGALDLKRRYTRFVAKEEIWRHPVAGRLMKGMEHIPVDRFGNVQAVMDQVDAKLRAGELVGMFPEGTISRSFVPMTMFPGAAKMAQEAGAPLVPVGIWGCHRILTKGRNNLKTATDIDVTISFGPAVAYEPDEDPKAITERLAAAIGELVDHAQRTYPQQPRDEEDRWWLPAHLGGSAPTPAEATRMAREERRAKREAARAAREEVGADQATITVEGREDPDDPVADPQARKAVAPPAEQDG